MAHSGAQQHAVAEPREIETAAEFNEILQSTSYVVADFHAEWCGPCHAIAPMYKKLAAELSVPQHLQFVKVDVDKLPQVAAEHGVTAMPTFLFFHDGAGYEGRSSIRGADPRTLVATAQEVSKKAGEEAAKGSKSNDQEAENTV